MYTISLIEPADFKAKAEVVGFFLEHQGKILVLHRQEDTTQGNTWGIPGGKLAKGETVIDASIRELIEETGYHLPTGNVDYLTKVYIKYPHHFDYVYHMVRAPLKQDPGHVKINFKEHKGFTWVTPQDALKMNLMLAEDDCIKLIYKVS